MLKVNGKVSSGMKKASMFMQKDTYVKQYDEKLGFTPYFGTLNITLDDNIFLDIKGKLKKHLMIIKGNHELGDVYFLKAKITNLKNKKSNKGAVLFPTKTIYSLNTLEFVSKDKLRENLNVEDGSKVIVELLIDENL